MMVVVVVLQHTGIFEKIGCCSLQFAVRRTHDKSCILIGVQNICFATYVADLDANIFHLLTSVKNQSVCGKIFLLAASRRVKLRAARAFPTF